MSTTVPHVKKKKKKKQKKKKQKKKKKKRNQQTKQLNDNDIKMEEFSTCTEDLH